MSWHFLERWIEKANQHSTLIGKFWITFLIVCRMVIVASVGDRVYSDEQSEFKCNTLQPGCTNVCFNKFSPISHLRFWSFQILLVATPSVMYIVYSGHNPKKSKSKNKKAQRKNVETNDDPQSRRHRTALNREIENEDAMNASNNNNNNKQGDDNTRITKNPQNSPGRFSGHKSRTGSKDGEPKSREVKINDEFRSQSNNGDIRRRHNLKEESQKVLTTLINYKYCSNDNKHPVQTNVVEVTPTNGKLWQEMRWNSVMHVAEESAKNRKNENTLDGLWKIPKDNNCNKTDPNRYCGDSEREKNGQKESEVIHVESFTWLPSSSDDDNRGGTARQIQPAMRSLMEDHIDMNQHGGENVMCKKIDLGNEPLDLIIPTAPPPPDYLGTLKQTNGQWLQDRERVVDCYEKIKNGKTDKQKKGFSFSQLEVVKTRKRKPRFTRHFHLYLLSVFIRLALELMFLLMQMYLYGFTVPEFYKCEQWPCPNVVDCFISRPMEKTIFLYFMLIYSCICVLLNLVEFKYLIWVYIFGRPMLVAKKLKPTSGPHIIYENGEPKYSCRFTNGDCDVDYDSADMDYDEDDESMMENGFASNKFCRNELKGKQGKSAGNLQYRAGRIDRYVQDGKERSMRDLDIIMDMEEDRDEYELDMAIMDQVDDIQMDIASVGGDNDINDNT